MGSFGKVKQTLGAPANALGGVLHREGQAWNQDPWKQTQRYAAYGMAPSSGGTSYLWAHPEGRDMVGQQIDATNLFKNPTSPTNARRQRSQQRTANTEADQSAELARALAMMSGRQGGSGFGSEMQAYNGVQERFAQQRMQFEQNQQQGQQQQIMQLMMMLGML